MMLNPATLPRAVLDTSVLVPRWSRLVLMRLANDPYYRYQPVWSEWIATETWRVLTTTLIKAGVPDDTISQQANAMFDYFLAAMAFASVANAQPIAAASPLRDPDDAYVWATAVVGDAGYVISHNTRHFPPLVREEVLLGNHPFTIQRHIHQGIEFLTAIEFIEEVLAVDAVKILGAALPVDGIIRSQRRVTPV